jgi:hypothetical protein
MVFAAVFASVWGLGEVFCDVFGGMARFVS